MARIDGDPRALHPGVEQTYAYIRDNVLEAGVVDTELKRLCFRFVAEDDETMEFSRFPEREQLALRWAQAIVWDADLATDELWESLRAEFSEPELVELGCTVGFALGQQHWERTLGFAPHAGLS